MGITYKKFAWLIEPERINENYLFGGVIGCPGDIVNGEGVLNKCNDISMHGCIECWNREIPYPVIAEAARDTISLAGFNIKKGSKFKICKVDMETKDNFALSIFDSENDVRRYVCADDFKFYIQKEEEKMSKFKVGDKVRIKKFKTRPEHWNTYGGMDRYAGMVVTISGNYSCGISIYEDGGAWVWNESDFAPVEFTKNDLKDGMMVEQRDGSRWIWLYGALRRKSVWCSGTKEDLTGEGEALDIVKIGYPEIDSVKGHLEAILESDFSEILWERTEKKEISSEEAFAVLKKHYGCDVKIKE